MKLFKTKTYNFDTSEIEFSFDPDEEGSGYALENNVSVLRITEPEYVESFLFYTHEFTEIAMLKALRKCTRKWMFFAKFQHFEASRVAHLVSPHGYPNRLTLFPDAEIRKAYKQLLHSLSKEQLAKRIEMGDGWNENNP